MFPPVDSSVHTAALEAILYNPYVNAFGHLGNSNFPFDHEYIISRCNDHGKIVEINNASLSIRKGSHDNCMDIARLCMKYEVPISVDSDSHICYRVGHVEGALEMLEEIGFPLIIGHAGGPRPASVRRCSRIGIDLGGTTIKAALCTENGTLLCKDSLDPSTRSLKVDGNAGALAVPGAQLCGRGRNGNRHRRELV